MMNVGVERSRRYGRAIMVAAGMLLAAVTLGLILMSGPAEASFPGNNGKIAFMSNRDDPNSSDIYVMKDDGTEVRRLTSSPDLESEPAFSPDGTRIAFTRGSDDENIWVMNANGTDQTRLTSHLSDDRRPAWSPDGTRIAFESERDGQVEIYVMNAAPESATNQPIRLTNSTTSGDRKPDFSPDGNRIAFHSDRTGDWEIYAMDAADTDNDGNGDNLKRLTTNPAFDTIVSHKHTGARIAFGTTRSSDGTGGGQELHVMDAGDIDNDGNGDEVTRIVEGPSLRPSWSPDGTKIAFDGDPARSEMYDIYVVSAGGGTPTNLTNTGDAADEFWSSWGPRPSDTTAPETTLDPSGPSGTVESASATFTFSSESNAAFDCKLDNGRFELCSSSTKTYNDLPDGQHRFEVRATDTSGNTDTSPAVRTWTSDTAPPTLTFNSGPNGQTFGTGSTQRWTFTAADTGSGVQSVQCSVVKTGDPENFGPCSGGNSSHSVSNLPVGSYTMSVRVTDRVGNVFEPPTRSFSIVPLLRISDVRVSERSPNALFTVRLSAASQRSVTVNYTTANGTAKAPADYATRRNTLTFLPGQTTKTIAVPIRNDRLDERTEYFLVRLSGAVRATIADGSGRGTIVDND